LKVLLDDDVPRKLAPFLTGHEIQTVVSMEWGGVKNGELPALVEREGFQVFITGGKNMPNQQQRGGRSFANLIMSAINWPAVKPHAEKIAAAGAIAEPGAVTLIDCGMFVPRSKSENTESPERTPPRFAQRVKFSPHRFRARFSHGR